MDIGSRDWMKNVDQIAKHMEESLSLEGTVVAQRASELREEAQKVCPATAVVRSEHYLQFGLLIPVHVCIGTGQT